VIAAFFALEIVLGCSWCWDFNECDLDMLNIFIVSLITDTDLYMNFEVKNYYSLRITNAGEIPGSLVPSVTDLILVISDSSETTRFTVASVVFVDRESRACGP
jgi:hypothetical protein